MSVYEHLRKANIIAILRGIPLDKITKVAEALYEGGVDCIEVTFNQSGDLNETVRAIEAIRQMPQDIYVGAGTVITTEQVDLAYQAGAQYIISPGCKESVIKRTKELGLISIPGAFTPSEIVNAYDMGADIIKVFPAGQLGPKYFKDVKAPISHIPLAAVGGVKVTDVQEYVRCGVSCFGLASNIIDKKAVENEDWQAITDKARLYLELIRTA